MRREEADETCLCCQFPPGEYNLHDMSIFCPAVYFYLFIYLFTFFALYPLYKPSSVSVISAEFKKDHSHVSLHFTAT